MMGESQGRIEIEAVKREIVHIANFRLMDALNRKVNANNDIIKENINLKQVNQEMNGAVELLSGQAKHLINENNALKNVINRWNEQRVNQWDCQRTGQETTSLNLEGIPPPPPPSENDFNCQFN